MQLIMCMLHSLYRMFTFNIWYVRFPVWAVTSPGACAYGASLPCRTACQHVLHACKRSHLPLT